MNREIKFRGQDERGCWHIGWLEGTNDGRFYILENDAGWTDDGFHNADFSGSYEVLEETIGQFTGLLDRNGKEVYEGDILSTRGNFKGVVKWHSRGYYYLHLWEFDSDYEPDVTPLGCLCAYEEERLEIIGNEFDNPDLISELESRGCTVKEDE